LVECERCSAPDGKICARIPRLGVKQVARCPYTIYPGRCRKPVRAALPFSNIPWLDTGTTFKLPEWSEAELLAQVPGSG
jgi:hypothetical protein